MITSTVRTAIQTLKDCRPFLSKQQYRTIRGQIIAGNVIGAMRGLDRIMKQDHPCDVCEQNNDYAINCSGCVLNFRSSNVDCQNSQCFCSTELGCSLGFDKRCKASTCYGGDQDVN